MNLNLKEIIALYLDKEMLDLKNHPLFKKIKEIVDKNSFILECISGCIKNIKNENMYIHLEVYNEKNEEIEIYDDGNLTAYTEVIIHDKKDRYKFSSWRDDSDFLESLEWIIKNLIQITNGKNILKNEIIEKKKIIYKLNNNWRNDTDDLYK